MTEFVLVDYTGKEKDTGRVFDTTSEEVAKKNGLYNKDITYKPVTMILGEKMLIEGFEEALNSMKNGEEREVEIPPEKAYGQRDSTLVKLIPRKFFKDKNIEPRPGLWLYIENMPARIQSVSGGRVRVDFNHELAGKTLVFRIKLEKKLKDEDEKIRALVGMYFPGLKEDKFKITRKEKEVELMLPAEVLKLSDLQARKVQLTENIKKYVRIEKVRVSEEY